jgi:hypothetical protein
MAQTDKNLRAGNNVALIVGVILMIVLIVIWMAI